MLLKDKNILLGVTGSIAIYKALEVIRLFVKNGANVRVVMSESAKRFITPLTFEALSLNRVLHKDSEDWSSDNNHIDIARWADVYLIAPCSANSINKLSHGIADGLVTEVALAYDKVKLIAPSANTKMYKNNFTTHSLKLLKLNNFVVIPTLTKTLACMEEGDGALANVEDIFYFTARELLKEEFWSNRRVVVTGGGTIEKIDSVRYISNFSSGKMANSLAKALFLKGSDVCLISSKKIKDLPSEVYFLDFESSNELQEYLVSSIRIAKKGILTKPTLMDNSTPTLILKKPFLFMVSAVSDFVPKFPQEGKIKKEDIGKEWKLELKKNIDILDDLNKEGIISIGFKAEMDKENAFNNALNMLNKKDLDAVCLNILDNENNFGSDNSKIDIITKNKIVNLKKDTKLNVSLQILQEVKVLDDE